MTKELSLWVLLLLLQGSNQVEAGALSRPSSAQSMQFYLFEHLWGKVNAMMSEALHLVGSFLPLRGMATVAKDLGIPYADSILTALTPVKSQPDHHPIVATAKSQRRSDFNSLREEMSSAVGTLLGKGQCQKRLACLGGRHLSHVNGASSIALMISTASNFLPSDFQEPLSTLKDAIMYSEDCLQYEC